MDKKITLYDAGTGYVIACSYLLAAGAIVLFPIFLLIAIKTVKKIKQYRIEEQKLLEQAGEEL